MYMPPIFRVMLTVTTAPGGKIRTRGLFLGEGRECLTAAVKLSVKKYSGENPDTDNIAVIILTGFLTYHAPDWLIFEDMG